MTTNFLKFLKTRAPLVLFLLCLILFCIVLQILDFHIKYNDIPNPDIKKDWNKVLESLSTLEFCLSSNKTHKNHYLTDSESNKVALIHSMVIKFIMRPAQNIISSQSRFFNTFLIGKQLGVKGIFADENVNVTFVLPPISKDKISCYFEGKCPHISVDICVIFKTYSDIFPTELGPPQCYNNKINSIEKSASTLYLTWHRQETLFKILSCSLQTSFKSQYILDPKLTVMLTEDEIDIIRAHVSFCIYCLLIIISIIFLYGISCGFRDLVINRSRSSTQSRDIDGVALSD